MKDPPELRVLRDVQLDETLAQDQERLLPEERRRADDQVVTSLRAVNTEARCRHIARSRFEDGPRLGERRASLPELDDTWVAGVGQAPRAEILPHPHYILVAPGQGRLGLREVEAAVDEALGDGIE